MKQKKTESDPQLSLGLSFKDARLLEYIRYRVSKLMIVLDEISFWRLPSLYLVLFVDGTIAYWLFFSILKGHELPPVIPILNFSPQVDTLTATGDILTLFFFLIVLHILSVYVSGKLFYRFRHLSVLLLSGCVLSSILYVLTVYKTISLTLP
jgi:hypothetical protein